MYLKTAGCQAPANPLLFSLYKPKSFSVFPKVYIFLKLSVLCFSYFVFANWVHICLEAWYPYVDAVLQLRAQ